MEIRTLHNGKKPLYQVVEDFEVKISSGKKITIPEGFITDFASVPRFLWPIFPPLKGNRADVAFIVHDYAYSYGYFISGINKMPISRREADYEMYYLQRTPYLIKGSLYGDSKWRAFFMWAAVRMFGAGHWIHGGIRVN